MENKNENDYQTRKLQAAELHKRDELGLISGIEHIFNEDGSVNWREMVPKEYLFPNKDLFKRRNKDLPSSIDGLKDYELCIKLGGIRHLAKLRGMLGCSFGHPRLEENYVVSQCTIDWMPNYESNFSICSYSDSANATINNCRDFGLKFLETIANNRAFIRAVRNYLNVNIVGEDELDRTESPSSMESDVSESVNSDHSPHTFFANKLRGFGIKKIFQIRAFMRVAREQGIINISDEEIDNINSFQSINSQYIIILLPIAEKLSYDTLNFLETN